MITRPSYHLRDASLPLPLAVGPPRPLSLRTETRATLYRWMHAPPSHHFPALLRGGTALPHDRL